MFQEFWYSEDFPELSSEYSLLNFVAARFDVLRMLVQSTYPRTFK
jgi:hypothetical protein